MSENIRIISDNVKPKSKAMDKLKEAWNENPLMVMASIGAALAGAGKFIDALTGYQSRRAYSQQVKNRNKNQG